jgi:alkylhydroperoxidase family enzyme
MKTKLSFDEHESFPRGPGARHQSYSARERAALAWTAAVTKITDHHVPDDVYDEARRHFSERNFSISLPR